MQQLDKNVNCVVLKTSWLEELLWITFYIKRLELLIDGGLLFDSGF